jgi:hypothetical protein
MRPGAVLMIASVALAPIVGAQSDARPAIVPEARVIIDSARAAGLPTEPLVDKALEGAAKRASSDRIVAAVRMLAARLGEARVLLGPRSGADELTAAASALRAGVSPQVIAQLRADRPAGWEGQGGQSLTIPLAVMAELVARGATPDSASARVLALTRRGVADAQLASVPREATGGAPPAEVGATAGEPGGSAADASPALNNVYHVPPPPPPSAPHKP